MKEPQFIQRIEDIGLAILPTHDPDDTSPPICFSQYLRAGSRVPCERQDTAPCSQDDILWADDEQHCYFCTNHFFPPEQNGYEFVEVQQPELNKQRY